MGKTKFSGKAKTKTTSTLESKSGKRRKTGMSRDQAQYLRMVYGR